MTYPWIDTDTFWGFISLNLFQTLITVHSMLIVFCFDNLVNLSCSNLAMLAEIIVGHLDELQMALKDEETSRLEIKKRILNIICMQRKYDE